MKKVGLYFGSFNPVHLGHVAIASYFAEAALFDEIWMVVSPHNPLKNEADLAPFEHRLEMVKLALEGTSGIKVCDVEQHLPTPSFTSQTMRHLMDEFPNFSFAIIIGEDSLVHFSKWKDDDFLMNHFDFYIFPRNISEENRMIVRSKYPNVHWMNAPLYDISSTAIRMAISRNESVDGLVTNAVANYISEHNLYQ